RRLAAVQRPDARHDPHRRHEHRDPDDARSDSLVPALAVATADEAVPRRFGHLERLERPLVALAFVDHRLPSTVARAVDLPFEASARTVDARTPRTLAASSDEY